MPQRNLDFDSRNLPQDVLAAIGLAVVCSAQTEHVVETGIQGCAGVDVEYGTAVTAPMPAPLRDRILRSVAEIRIGNRDDLEELDRLLQQIKAAFDRRNALIHCEWCRDRDTNELFRVRRPARADSAVDLVPTTIDDIRGDASFIYWAGLNLWDFLRKRRLLPPIPPARRPRRPVRKTTQAKPRPRKLRGVSS